MLPFFKQVISYERKKTCCYLWRWSKVVTRCCCGWTAFYHRNGQGEAVVCWTEMLPELEQAALDWSRCCTREDMKYWWRSRCMLLPWRNWGWERRVNYVDSLVLVTGFGVFLGGWRNFIEFLFFWCVLMCVIFFFYLILSYNPAPYEILS